MYEWRDCGPVYRLVDAAEEFSLFLIPLGQAEAKAEAGMEPERTRGSRNVPLRGDLVC